MMNRESFTRRDFLTGATLAVAGLPGAALLMAGEPVQKNDTEESTPHASSEISLKAVRFKLDVTPPVGSQLAFSLNDKVDAPIYVSGVVLDDGRTRILWCSCDFLYIIGSAYDLWRQAMAAAVGIPVANVFLHSVHQHDSIRISLADDVCPVPDDDACYPIDESWQKKTLQRISETLKELVAGDWVTITRVTTSESRTNGLAANRLCYDKSGKMYWRGGMSTDPVAQSLPTGLIDPVLRTICLETGVENRPWLALHFYATHPQSAYRRKMVGPDVPGYAVRYAEEKTPDCVHVYFNGCGANLSFGKYNPSADGKAIEQLGTRLGEALLANLAVRKPCRPGPISLTHADVAVPPDWSRIERRDADSLAVVKRILPERLHSHISLAGIGPDVHFLSFGLGELCIEYQLYAQSLVPEQFLATAAYSDCYYQYMPVADMIKQQKGEGSSGSCWALPEIEEVLKKGIEEALADLMLQRL